MVVVFVRSESAAESLERDAESSYYIVGFQSCGIVPDLLHHASCLAVLASLQSSSLLSVLHLLDNLTNIHQGPARSTATPWASLRLFHTASGKLGAPNFKP